ncbi:hypothetical protein OHA18_15010 [Kribbella sp. NBC_00709]|uniref:hypothetical protein n=1 Tax=Kribbella sp. NBC_00709 TaxID=2975972 RepID=UPI002E2C6CA6|nr:hypothetical protein [Kribbella sp. NBC_00709]
MSGSEIVSVITYAGMAASVVMVISVLRLHGHAWQRAGRRKWLWALLPVVTYFMLLSIPVALWYYVAIRPSVARADADCIARRRSRRAGRLQASPPTAQQPEAPISDEWFTSPKKQACTCDGGRVMCWNCSGHPAMQDANENWHYCSSCSGGYTTCLTCGGTGYR